MSLKADFHMHTIYSRDCDTAPKKLVNQCKAVGLNCIAVTDHNSIRGALEVKELADFTVIIGEEVKTNQGDIIGLFLEEEIPGGTVSPGNGTSYQGPGGPGNGATSYRRRQAGPIEESGLEGNIA